MAIRTFSSPSEYRSLGRFKEDNPVSPERYFGVVGDYKHPEYEEKCCFQKENGRLCGREHKFGYVVQLKDQSFSIIGNHCAETKFDAESALRVDISRFKEEREIRETLDAIAELLTMEGEIIDSVSKTLRAPAAAKRKMKRFEQRIGLDLTSKLHDMSQYTNDDGEKKEERLHVPITAGRLRGLAALPRLRFYSAEGCRTAIEDAFADARQGDSRASGNELKACLLD